MSNTGKIRVTYVGNSLHLQLNLDVDNSLHLQLNMGEFCPIGLTLT